MKLLVYVNSWAPSVGGVETITKILAEGLVEWSKEHHEAATEVTLITKTPAGNLNDSQLPYRVVRSPSFLQLAHEIRIADVVHLAGPTLVPLLITYLLRKPTVVEHHGYQVNCPNGLLLFQPDRSVCPGHFMAGRYGKCIKCNQQDVGWIASVRGLLLTFLRRWFCLRVAGNIAITNHVAKRIELPRTRTIYYGVYDRGERSSDESSGSHHALAIGYVGRLVQEKGLPVLLHAVEKLDKSGAAFHLTFVGDGPERARLQGLSERLGLDDRVTFKGDLRGKNLLEVLKTIQVVIMPSEWEETAGLAAIEQMMSAGAVIVADIGGLSEVVGQAGRKFSTGNAEELYACLETIVKDRSEIKQLGTAARARALREFSVNRFIAQHSGFYREVQENESPLSE